MDQSELDSIAEIVALLAKIDFSGTSPLYERLAQDIVSEPDVLALLLPAAPNDRLPHLLFAAVQYLMIGAGDDMLETLGDRSTDHFVAWCRAHADELVRLIATRVVQTNEVGRCAGIMPCLAAVAEASGQPIALLEVGTSGGLNLGFDRFRYVYGDGCEVGAEDAAVVLRPTVEGAAPQHLAIPEVVWRRGLDRSPIDITDDDAVRWLRACIWPEQRQRAELLAKAVASARTSPPTIVRGDAVDALPGLVAAAPADTALCIVHSAVLTYLPDQVRFRRLLDELALERRIWWIPGEPQGLVPELVGPPPPSETVAFLYGVVPLGITGVEPCALVQAHPHGAWLRWLPSSWS